jgi:hypothetical protein
MESMAVAIWTKNVRETRAHFAALRDQAYERWLKSDMSITHRDALMARLRAREEYYMDQERKLYYLNRAAEGNLL